MIPQDQQCNICAPATSAPATSGLATSAPAAVADTDSLLALLSQAELPSHLLTQISQQLERLEEQIQAQAQVIDQLRQESRTDSLTGLPNRRTYSETLSAEWTRAMRTRQPLTLISIDVDHFKQYNDRYGHDQGDWCLQQVAEAMKQSVQRGGDLVCRIGGEEFVVIVPGATAQDAAALAEKIRLNLAARALRHESSTGKIVTLSMGIAHAIPSPNQTPDDLYRAADQALYQAKQQGRNQISLVESSGASTLGEPLAVLAQVKNLAQVKKVWELGLPNRNSPISLSAIDRTIETLAASPSPVRLENPASQTSSTPEPIRVRFAQMAYHSRSAFARARLHCLARMSDLSAQPGRILGLLDS